MKNKVYVTKKAGFEACHSLPIYEGKCHNMHGHSYKLEVTASGYIEYDKIDEFMPSTEAMVVDFTELKSLINTHVVDVFDHKNLNSYFSQPTAEVLAVYIFNVLQDCYAETPDIKIDCVKVWETEDSYAEYRGEIEDVED